MASSAEPAEVAAAEDADDGPSPLGFLIAAYKSFSAHGMGDNAAGLVYFAMMSLFPTLLAIVSLLGLFGASDLATRAGNYVADQGADGTTADAVRNALKTVTSSGGGAASFALLLSILLALNGASGAFAAAGRALNLAHGVEEDRSFVRRKLTDVGWTLVVILLLIVVLVSLFLGGGIAHDLFGTIGLGDTGATVWSIVRWPVALAVALLVFAVVYAFAPDVSVRRLRWISPGAVFGVVVWIVASIGFSIYLRNFSSYGAAYGAAGAVIALLLWLYITANVFLLGAELNVAIDRSEQAGRGGPPLVTPPPQAPGPTTYPAPAEDPAADAGSQKR